jgi:protein-S-isoprenylcysteine O-methyltransferase Ste14
MSRRSTSPKAEPCKSRSSVCGPSLRESLRPIGLGNAVTTETRDNAGVRIFPPAIYLIGLAAGFLVYWFWPVHVVPVSQARVVRDIRWIGGVFAVLPLGLVMWSVRTFRLSGTTPNPTRPTTKLAFGGPYRFTRNPMYVSLALIQTGISLIANALWPLVAVLPVLYVARRVVIDREEAYLERKFGEQYLAYKRRVRRWI